VVGDEVTVEADAFADGHDVVVAILRHRPADGDWIELPMEALGNDRWRASFPVERIGRHEYQVVAWTDSWQTWRGDLGKRLEAGQNVAVDLLIGAQLVAASAERAGGPDGQQLAATARRLESEGDQRERSAIALDPELDRLMTRHADRSRASESGVFGIVVDPLLARYSTWYELFPRSASKVPGHHGTFRDVIERLPYVQRLGFDVLYLPPIHPIGRTFRKGPNNVTTASPHDPGVPWAIGSPEGGHTAIHPELGTEDDFRALVESAHERGISVALDIAFQASPDHPAVREHPSWFRQRPDGTVQYAENPPKKYQDIYPFDFESDDADGLWQHLCEVVRYWIARGVTVFRVDNPHTKPFPFWQWLIGEIKRDHPDAIFLAEAFTRPKIMYRLGKLGFSQSYTYFTWRNTKWELQSYFEELSTPPVVDFFRPNAWPNTPDILHETLQHGGRAAFEARLVLAATLSANYGIYGPAYELQQHVAREPGSEEYLDSEKYQIQHWELEDEHSIAPLIQRVNRIRREHPALQRNEGLRFHEIHDDALLAYTKRHGDDVVLTIASLDFRTVRRATLDLVLWELGLPEDRPYEAEDLLEGSVSIWQGRRHEIEIDPGRVPARILHLRPQTRDETRFEGYA
jgi:starch synthase (maltosyl-transferring)